MSEALTERTLDALPALIVTATAAYVSTNVDGYALLLGFFSNERYRAMEIVAGQFLSMATQLAISIAVMRSGWVAHSPLVGLVGAVPLLAGLKRIAQLRRRDGPRKENAVCRESPGHGTFGPGAVPLLKFGISMSSGIPSPSESSALMPYKLNTTRRDA